MTGATIYAFRVMRLPLLDAGGVEIGKVADVVLVPGRTGKPSRVVGFVASSQRRQIFVNAARISRLDGEGAHLRSWDLDLHPFKRRPGEMLIGAELIDSVLPSGETVSDIGLTSLSDGRVETWEVATVRLAKRQALRRRPSFRLAHWTEVSQVFSITEPMAAEAARLRDMHPSDVASVVRVLPLTQRKQLAEAMDDERLADLLEELPEDEQLRLIEGLDIERLISVLDEMEYDDLTDLLGEMPPQQRTAILEAMGAEEAEVLTRLLSYGDGTAGGLMTPEVVILGPEDTVAEALAHVRNPDWTQAIAGQVFICERPVVPPTGRYLGVVFSQRLLREPPSMALGQCLRQVATAHPDISEADVYEQFASYNMLSLPVIDEAGRLLGAVTVDDVVDRMLGAGWRLRRRRQPETQPAVTP